MYNRLSREELRIIEQTKKEGIELEKKEKEEGETKKTAKALSLIYFILIFILLAIGMRLLIGYLNQGVR